MTAQASRFETLGRLFRRPPTVLASVVVASAVGAVAAWLEQRGSAASDAAPRVLLLVLAYASACAAFVVAVSALELPKGAVLAAHFRVGAASTLVLGWTALDLLHFKLFKSHIDAAALHLGWEAVRSKSLRVGPADVASLLAALAFGVVGFGLLHAQLSRIGTSPRTERASRVAAAGIVVAGLLGGLFHERLWDARHADAARLAHALPWAPNLGQARVEQASTGFGAPVDAAVANELEKRRGELPSAKLRAERLPDLLIVHVESLRADMFTRELMPKLSALAEECVVSPRHYATGNNTGSAVFGLVSGLAAFQYPYARESPAPALPLVVLHRLGYRNSVHLANNLADYDKIYDIVFEGAIDDKFTAPDAPSDQMDQAVIAHYVASLGKTPGPRFDYLVLDSTHYDYSYPPEYGRFEPSGTLGLGIRDGFIEGAEVVAHARERASLVENRYKNSVVWMDTLLARLVEGMRAAGRWQNTWVAILGDHGEAFFEHESFGHGMGLEEEQIRVPLVLCGLGTAPIRGAQSSHADLFPTWFERMGLSGAPGPFMTGRPLFERPENDVVSVGMGITGQFTTHRFVAIGAGSKVVFDDVAALPIVAVTDLDDRPSAVSNGAERVLAGALGSKLLRSP